jgi:hypothetical protein
MEQDDQRSDAAIPRIVDLEVFPTIELVEARDRRMTNAGGRWFGNYETPTVLSKRGLRKRARGTRLAREYGRKESEGKDYNEDTNFGKLKRIPHEALQAFLKRHKFVQLPDGDKSLEKAIDEVKLQDETLLQEETRPKKLPISKLKPRKR